MNAFRKIIGLRLQLAGAIISALAVTISAVSLFVSYESLQQTSLTSQAQMRAYVFAEPGPVFNVSAGRRPEPYIIIKNSGQTFAKNVRRWAEVTVSEPLPVAELNSLQVGKKEEGSAILAPSVQSIFIRYGSALNDEHYSQIVAPHGGRRIYVHGTIEYEDIFGVAHQTRFCFMYFGEQQDWPQNGGMGYNPLQAKYCEAHNSIHQKNGG
jgi:hypothetical protein